MSYLTPNNNVANTFTFVCEGFFQNLNTNETLVLMEFEKIIADIKVPLSQGDIDAGDAFYPTKHIRLIMDYLIKAQIPIGIVYPKETALIKSFLDKYQNIISAVYNIPVIWKERIEYVETVNIIDLRVNPIDTQVQQFLANNTYKNVIYMGSNYLTLQNLINTNMIDTNNNPIRMFYCDINKMY